jgi:GDP-mannose 6-dehydrogenase
MSNPEQKNPLPICVCGLGYVGAVTVACLARLGHKVIGVDTVHQKVELMNAGHSPLVENGLPELISEMVEVGRLSATTEITTAVRESDITLVCVGTPSRSDGSLNSDAVRKVCTEIGEALRDVDRYHLIVIRSTLLPGVTSRELIPLLEQTSGKTAGVDFGVCMNPEFLREGNAIEDFFEPSRTVIGELDQRSGDVLAAIYEGISGPVFRTRLGTAEIVKYSDNWWHALKVAFGNEVGALADTMGVDGHEVMEIFLLDTKLNISSKYLRPGMAFGGSCLPKDLRALNHFAAESDLNLPVLQSVLPSNSAHTERTLRQIRQLGARRIGFLGLTFKPGTDDTRESPTVAIIATLIAEGFEVLVHDENIDLDIMSGANQELLLSQIGDLKDRLVEDADVLCQSVEGVIVTYGTLEYSRLMEKYGDRASFLDLS